MWNIGCILSLVEEISISKAIFNNNINTSSSFFDVSMKKNQRSVAWKMFGSNGIGLCKQVI